MTARATAAWAVVAAAALFGTSATSVALLAPDAPATATAALRLILGAVGLLALVMWRTGVTELRELWRRPVVWLMGAAVAGYQVFFFVGTSRTGVAVGTLASLALAPFLAGLLAWILHAGAPGWIWAGSTVLAVIGLSLLTLGGLEQIDLLGILAASGAGACYAVYTVIGARLASSGSSSTAVLAAAFTIGGILLIPFAIAGGWWWMSVPGVVLVAWLGLIATTLAYVLFGVGLRRLPAGHVATLNLAEPVVATLLGVVVVGERLSAGGWVGCALIIGALGLLGLAQTNGSGTKDTQANDSKTKNTPDQEAVA